MSVIQRCLCTHSPAAFPGGKSPKRSASMLFSKAQNSPCLIWKRREWSLRKAGGGSPDPAAVLQVMGTFPRPCLGHSGGITASEANTKGSLGHLHPASPPVLATWLCQIRSHILDINSSCCLPSIISCHPRKRQNQGSALLDRELLAITDRKI